MCRLALAAVLALAGACQTTDMWYQPSLGPEEAPRPEPEGSVPLGAGPSPADVDEADELPNPVAPTDASVAHGKQLFAERCSFCHGDEGKGGGPVSHFFPPAPDLAYPTIVERSDGHLYGTVTLGGRAMPVASVGLTPVERWDLVNYIRRVQRRGQGGAP